MKLRYLSCLICILLISCTTDNFSDIEGEWLAEGYNCENLVGLKEEINIEKHHNTFYAIKITGDDCIQAGDTSWFGRVENDRIAGKVKGMNPQTSEYKWTDCEIFENRNHLYLYIDQYRVLIMERK